MQNQYEVSSTLGQTYKCELNMGWMPFSFLRKTDDNKTTQLHFKKIYLFDDEYIKLSTKQEDSQWTDGYKHSKPREKIPYYTHFIFEVFRQYKFYFSFYNQPCYSN